MFWQYMNYDNSEQIGLAQNPGLCHVWLPGLVHIWTINHWCMKAQVLVAVKSVTGPDNIFLFKYV